MDGRVKNRSGILIKGGPCQQDVLEMAAKMFSVQRIYYRPLISLMTVKNYIVTAATADLFIVLSMSMETRAFDRVLLKLAEKKRNTLSQSVICSTVS